MTTTRSSHVDAISRALRQIARALDLRSRAALRVGGLTGPQAVVVRALAAAGALSVGDLARQVDLSQATVTDIVQRLEHKQLLQRARSEGDRRRVLVSLTPAGRHLALQGISQLDETFLERFAALQPWEQTQMLAVLQRTAAMLNAEPGSASNDKGQAGNAA